MTATGGSSEDGNSVMFPQVAPPERLVVRSRPQPSARGLSNSQYHRLNNRLAVALVAVVGLATIPLASNRPALWMIWSVVVSAIGLLYGARLLLMGAPARVPLQRFALECALICVLWLYLAVQLLPFAGFFPAPVTLADGSQIVSPSISLAPGDTALMLVTMGTFALLFFLFSQVAANRRRARIALRALFLIIAASAIFALISLTQLGDTLLGFEKRYYLGFATGTFVNRNSFATFLASGLAIGIPVLLDSVSTALAEKSSRQWVFVGVVAAGIVFIVAALLASGSRMGVFAGGAGALVTFGIGLFTIRNLGRSRLVFVLLAIVAAGALLIFYGSGVMERLIFTHDEDGRGELYAQVWQAILQRPWLGYGGGSFPSTFPVFQHAPLAGEVVWDHAHSTYLALWFEMGLVFGSIPLLIIASLTVRSVLGFKDRSNNLLALSAVGVVVVFGLHSIVDFSAEIMANAFLLIAVLALGAGARAPSEQEQKA
ncbi:O-antigen ligase family protein [Devosia sp.]|uniref:O-antigen ligase family protein n=1 Tax=Devosia sp. TaxID=1871048 RepID=UPI003BAB1BC1